MKKLIGLVMVIGAFSAGTQAAEMPAKVQSCVGCHGVDGNSTSPIFPKLAGQHAAYLENALKAYRDGFRRNDMMNRFAKGLSDQDIKEIAAYYAAQKPK
ncbi:MAG TPA: cytochrome c [Piscirickettsiaceae bacterium]|nr:cytochrome c [Piscirickettsiaceae bacterium]HIQ40000.1 cytochrome c [Sulfurivirga caldicuralii]